MVYRFPMYATPAMLLHMVKAITEQGQEGDTNKQLLHGIEKFLREKYFHLLLKAIRLLESILLIKERISLVFYLKKYLFFCLFSVIIDDAFANIM